MHNNHQPNEVGCEIYQIIPAWIFQNPTRVWYYKDKQNATAGVGLDCTFANGQRVYVTALGKFNMYRPSIAKWDALYTGTPQVQIHSSELVLGDDIVPMTFQHYIQSEFSGTAGYTQLISGEWDNDLSKSTSGFELDNVEWYRGQKVVHTGNWTQNQVPFDDKPSVSLAILNNATAMDLSFRTYLRFRPDVGNTDDNIFVTLRLVTWGVTASATKAMGAWTVDPGSSFTGPNDSNSAVFPAWTKINSNSGL